MRNIYTPSALMVVIIAGCACSHQSGAAPASTGAEICRHAGEQEITALFDRWNLSLQTVDAGEELRRH